jgi:hypothetical protein
MFGTKLQPARPEPQNVVQDLDALIEKPSFVKLHGKVFEIKPMLVNEFFYFANAMAGIRTLENAEDFTLDDVVEAYFSILSPLMVGLTKDDIRNCSSAQISALMAHVMDHVMGKANTEEKKKSLKLLSQ